MSQLYLALDIGGTALKAGLLHADGTVLKHTHCVTPQGELKELLDVCDDLLKQLAGHEKIAGLALSTPGAVDSDSGIIHGASALPYIHGPNFKHLLSERYQLPVEIENDANCAALAEVWLGAAQANQDSCFVVIGTGIGGAIVKNRRIHKGAHRHGGEFGFAIFDVQRDQPRTISDVASTGALVRFYNTHRREGAPQLNGQQIFERAINGDAMAREAIDRFYHALAICIYNIQYMYDPERIVLGGAISQRTDLVAGIEAKLDTLFDAIPISTVRPDLHCCHFHNKANLLGAFYHFLQRHPLSMTQHENHKVHSI